MIDKLIKLNRTDILSEPAFLPGVALLSFGCIVPLITHIDVYLMILRPFDLASLYGTDYLVLSAVGLAAAALLWFGEIILHRLFGWNWPRHVSLWFARFAFLLIACFSVAYLLKAWLRSFGFNAVDVVSGETYVVVAFILTISARPNGWLASWFDRLVRSARVVAITGSVTLLFVLQSFGDDAPQPQSGESLGPRRPDIVLISIDALSAVRMSLYGAKRKTTPNIDRFAKSALVFDKAFATSNFTTPGINSILTGLYPTQHRALQLTSRPTAEARAHSLPALLKASGYYTGFVATNPWGGALRNGYGRYFDFHAPDRMKWQQSQCQDRLSVWLARLCNTLNPFVISLFRIPSMGRQSNDRFDPMLVNASARDFLQRRKGPSFLWVHYMPPHDPYAAPTPWLGRFDSSNRAQTMHDSSPVYGVTAGRQSDRTSHVLAARYDEAMAWVDDAVGKLLNDVIRASPNAIVIIVADHGESFSHGWGGHGGALLNKDVVHIPLIVRLPGSKGASKRTQVLASQIDILPIIRSAVAGSDANQVVRMIEARRQNQPVLMMAFNDNRANAPLTQGTIAATDGKWQFTNYVGVGFKTTSDLRQKDVHDFTTPHGDSVGANAAPQRSLILLQKAIDDERQQFGGVTPQR